MEGNTQSEKKTNIKMNYHNFYRWAALPAGFIVLGLQFINSIPSRESSILISIDMGFCFISMMFFVACFIGFVNKRRYSINCVIAIFVLNMARQVFAIIVFVNLVPNEVASAIGQLIGYMIVAIPTIIYYCKRRSFFCN